MISGAAPTPETKNPPRPWQAWRVRNIREIFMTDIDAACKDQRACACETPKAFAGIAPLRLLCLSRPRRRA